jgi:hypothetical protein
MQTKQLAAMLLIFGGGLLIVGLILSVATSTSVSASPTLPTSEETPCMGCHIDWQLSSHDLILETPVPISKTENCIGCHIDMASAFAQQQHLTLFASRGIGEVGATHIDALQVLSVPTPFNNTDFPGEPGASPDSFSPLQDWNTP